MMPSEDEAFVRALLEREAGLEFQSDQSSLIASRLVSLAHARGLDGPAALLGQLKQEPFGDLLDAVIDELTTHETSFFRDPWTFSLLERDVLPDLIARRRGARCISIWSAGCSTGQEPYSLSMLLHEKFPELAGWKVSILATDVGRATIRKAREGRYSALEIKRGLSVERRRQYFTESGAEFRLCRPLRDAVTFEVSSLTGPWPPMARFDLVLMRNVLIYFSQQERARVLERTVSRMSEDGALLLGATETTFGVCSALEPCAIGGATVYRKRPPLGASERPARSQTEGRGNGSASLGCRR